MHDPIHLSEKGFAYLHLTSQLSHTYKSGEGCMVWYDITWQSSNVAESGNTTLMYGVEYGMEV